MKYDSTRANIYSLGGKHSILEWNCAYCRCYQRVLTVFTAADGQSVIAFFKGMSACQLQLSQHPPPCSSGRLKRSGWCSYRVSAITGSHRSTTTESRKNTPSQSEQKASLTTQRCIGTNESLWIKPAAAAEMSFLWLDFSTLQTFLKEW